MAKTLTIAAQVALVMDGLNSSSNPGNSITLVGNAAISNIQTIGTTTEALSIGDILTPSYLFVKNQDATNFIQIGLTTAVTAGNAMFKLLPGEWAFIPTRRTVIYALADTSACDLLVIFTEL